MIDSLRREQVIHVAEGVAEADELAERVIPESLAAAIDGRLDYLSGATQHVLRMATLLGAVFSVADLAVVLDQRPTELLPAIEEAIAAEVLVESDMRLAFRHGLIHLACYEQIPKPLRIPLHRQAAKALAASGAELAKVAEQVVPSAALMDTWLLTWLDDNIEALTVQAPQMAVDLLDRAVHRTMPAVRGAIGWWPALGVPCCGWAATRMPPGSPTSSCRASPIRSGPRRSVGWWGWPACAGGCSRRACGSPIGRSARYAGTHRGIPGYASPPRRWTRPPVGSTVPRRR
jgi:hypothetical protein